MIVSVHSFTQAWKGVPRPWSVGVLWDKDPRLALPLLDALRTIPGIEVGDNAPYSGQLKGDTLYRHGTERGLAHALIEVRQDLILSEEGQAEWAGRLADALRTVMRDESALHAIELHGSYTDGANAEAVGRSRARTHRGHGREDAHRARGCGLQAARWPIFARVATSRIST